MTYSRRDWCLLAAALAAAPGRLSAQNAVLPSRVYPYDKLPVKDLNGNQTRPIMDGTLHTGYHLEVHETRLAPGSAPHPPHHHVHEEMFLLREGTLEVTIAGKVTRMGPGSVGYVASDQMHGVRNVGTGPAEYFVVAMGTDK